MSTVPQQPAEDRSEQPLPAFVGRPTEPPQPPADQAVDQSAEQPTEPAAKPKTNRGVGQVYVLLVLSVVAGGIVGGPLLEWSRFVALAVIEASFLVAAVMYVHHKGLPVAAVLQWRPISFSGALLSVGLGASAGIAVGIGLLTIAILAPCRKTIY